MPPERRGAFSLAKANPFRALAALVQHHAVGSLVIDKAGAGVGNTARKGIFMIDASKGFKKDGPKNRLREQDLHKIVDTFTRLDESDPRYARMVPVAEIADPKNDFNLNISRYISTAVGEEEIDLAATNQALVDIEKAIGTATEKHNGFLKELGLPLLPANSGERTRLSGQ